MAVVATVSPSAPDDPTAALRRFLDASPSPWHAVAVRRRRCSTPPASRRSTRRRRGPTSPTPGSSCAAARWSPGAGHPAPVRCPVRLVGAHTDSPGLRIKPRPDIEPGRLAPARRRGLRRRAAQQLARPGPRRRRAPRRSPTARRSLVAVHEPIARVPQLAIHLDRDVNERGLVLDRQAHMTPGVGHRPRHRLRRLDRRAGRHRRRRRVGAVPVRRAAGRRARRRPLAAGQRAPRQPGVVLGGDDGAGRRRAGRPRRDDRPVRPRGGRLGLDRRRRRARSSRR